MQWKARLLIATGVMIFCVTATVSAKVVALVETQRLGSAAVKIIEYKSDQAGPYFIHLHSNEKTALTAARRLIQQKGGTVMTLSHAGGRLIRFKLKGKQYVFDPNRIFSDPGIKATLKFYGPYSHAAFAEVHRFSSVLLKKWPRDRFVSVHNNAPGRYNIAAYVAGGKYAKEAKEVFVHPAMNPDDFFLVNTMPLFNFFMQHRQNVVLEAEVSDLQPGALSVYASKYKIPYINVEAQHGRLHSQINMLKLIYKLKD